MEPKTGMSKSPEARAHRGKSPAPKEIYFSSHAFLPFRKVGSCLYNVPPSPDPPGFPSLLGEEMLQLESRREI